MAHIHDLPPEVLKEIFLLVLLNDQSLPPEPGFETDPELFNHSHLEERNAFQAHSLKKVLPGTFIEGLEAIHTCKACGTGGDLLHYHFDLYQDFNTSQIQRRDILALNATSKRFRDVAREQLWRVVELHQVVEKGIDDVQGVLESLLNTPVLGQLVRSLSFRSNAIEGGLFLEVDIEQQLDEWARVVKRLFALKASPDEIDLSCTKKWSVWLQLALLVLLLPNLRSLKLSIDVSSSTAIQLWINGIEDPSNDYFQSIPDLFANRLKHLQEFSFMIDDPEDDSIGSRLLDFPFKLPSLKTVYFGQTSANDIDQIADHPVPEKYRRTSEVTSLTIEQSLMSVENLTVLLQFPKGLESFTFSYGGPSNHLSTAEAREICTALLPHRNSLTKLIIRGYHDLREEEQEPVGSLITQFPALKEIGIPVALLQTADLTSAFPQSVVRLRLHMYDEWTLRECEDQMRRLLVRKGAGLVYPGLKEIWVEYWCSAESEQTRAESGWARRRQKVVEDMVAFGRDVGVKLEFDVDEISKTVIWK